MKKQESWTMQSLHIGGIYLITCANNTVNGLKFEPGSESQCVHVVWLVLKRIAVGY